MIQVNKDGELYDHWTVLTKAKEIPSLYHNIKNLKWTEEGKFMVKVYKEWKFSKLIK